MPQSMSKTQILRFTRFCEDQGIRVTKTKKGLLLRFPDGSSTVQHFTNSDVRAEPNQIARFRRAGMVHPNDTKQQKDALPSYITSGSISEKTKKKIVDYVASQGYPEAVLSSSVVRDLKMDPGWANRALYHSGFRPGKAKSRKVGRPWYTPDEILCLKPDTTLQAELDQIVEEVPDQQEEAVERIIERETTAEEEIESPPGAMGDTGDEPVKFVDVPDGGFDERTTGVPPIIATATKAIADDLEYIDTRDSWVLAPETLFGEKWNLYMADELRVLKALGIEYEIRVWRATTE